MFENLQNTDLVERRKQALESSANQRYQDMLADLGRQQNVFQGQFESGRNLANEQLAAARSLATQNAVQQERQARGTYEDLITQARQRARAMGGVTGSGVLDMYGDVDRNLQQNLYGIGQSRERGIGEAQMSTNQQLAGLQNEFNSRVAQIEADRTKSLREKNDLLSEIEFGYMGALDKINRAGAGGRGGSGYGAYGVGGGQQWADANGDGINDFEIEIPDGSVLGESTGPGVVGRALSSAINLSTQNLKKFSSLPNVQGYQAPAPAAPGVNPLEYRQMRYGSFSPQINR